MNVRFASVPLFFFAGGRLAVGAAVDPAVPRYELRPLVPPQHATYQTADGAISIVGYNDMAEMLGALTTGFAALHPGFAFALALKGTRTAPPALASGKSALAPMGADFSPRELADFRAVAGGEPLVIRIAHASLNSRALSGPLAIFVHRDNPLASLTMTDLAAIFTGADTARGLRPCGVNADAALGFFFRERVLGGRSFATDFVGFPQSADVVKRVGEDVRAIGFAGAMRATPDVRILALAPNTSSPAIALNDENLITGRYPLDRHLLICARQPLEPWVREFLRFVLARDGQQLIASGTLGYLPLSARDAAIERAKLAPE